LVYCRVRGSLQVKVNFGVHSFRTPFTTYIHPETRSPHALVNSQYNPTLYHADDYYSCNDVMPILKEVEVRIKSAGELLTEYNDPDESAPGDANTTTKFVEATSGAKFSIEVSINRGYYFNGADCVIINRCMDGQACRTHHIVSKKARSNPVTQALKRSIHNDKAFDTEDGQWKTGSLTFARVEICMIVSQFILG